jgi:hypothetical protein
MALRSARGHILCLATMLRGRFDHNVDGALKCRPRRRRLSVSGVFLSESDISGDPPEDYDDPSHREAMALLTKIQQRIGAVVNGWATLDNSLIHLLARLAGCPSYSAGIIFYSLNSLATQVSIIKGLAKHNLDDDDIRTEIMTTLTRLRELSNTRNEFVHSVYYISRNPDKTKWIVKKSTFRSERKELVSENNAQTGEIEHHLLLINDLETSLTL